MSDPTSPTPLFDGFGSTLFPVTRFAPDGRMLTAAGTLDKGKTALYELLTAAVNYECGAAWRTLIEQEDTFLRYQAVDNKLVQNPIMFVMTIVPDSQNLTQIKENWPLIAVYREGEPTYEKETLKATVRKQNFAVDYIIGPLGADTQDRYGDFVVQVINAMWEAIDYGRHPAYRDGISPFQGVFSSVRVVTSTGPGCSEVTDQKAGSGYFGGSLVIEVGERSISQANSELGSFERDAFYYDRTFPGYGDTTIDPEVAISIEGIDHDTIDD